MKELTKFQKGELFSYYLYLEISKINKNKKILRKFAFQELKHYNLFKILTNKEIKINFLDKMKIKIFVLLYFILGPKFIIKLLEKNEENDINKYEKLLEKSKGKEKEILEKILKDEKIHEKELINLIKDNKVENIDSIVLGMNDALVELTGALMGLAGLFNDNLKIAFSGLITGVAAALSMAASSYLSKKAETNNNKKALVAALYTGLAYIITVLILVFPFFIFKNKVFAVVNTLANVIIIIMLYSYYFSVVKDGNFKKEFITMTLISFSVSALSYILGHLADSLFLS